jgi:tRNA 2-thiouridine synthesizing protein A
MNKIKSPEISSDIATNTGPSDVVADQTIDITRDICPMTFVRTRLALDRLPKGAVLKVLLRGAEPLRNVPRTAAAQGHAVLHMDEAADGITALWLRRG